MPYFIEFQFDALVVDKMGNAALGGMPFLIANRIITDAAAGTLEVQRNHGTYRYRFDSSDKYVKTL